MNEKVGGFDIDFNLTPERAESADNASSIAYQAGRINDGAYLDQVAMIDSRGTGNIDPLLIHTMHHSFALKDRIEASNGSADNHVVWRGGSPAPAFDTMDAWLTAVEADDSDSHSRREDRCQPTGRGRGHVLRRRSVIHRQGNVRCALALLRGTADRCRPTNNPRQHQVPPEAARSQRSRVRARPVPRCAVGPSRGRLRRDRRVRLVTGRSRPAGVGAVDDLRGRTGDGTRAAAGSVIGAALRSSRRQRRTHCDGAYPASCLEDGGRDEEVDMKLWARGTALGAAFLLGAALTGVATGHSGSGALLHSRHSDTMDGTLTAKGFKFETKKTSRVAVPAPAFQASGGTLDQNQDGYATLVSGGDAVAPVLLPDRAVVTRLTWFHDDNPAFNSYMRLYAGGPQGGTGLIAGADIGAGEDCQPSPIEVCSTTDDTIDPNLDDINNRSWHYFLDWHTSDAQVTHKVVIVYKVATPGPS